MAMRCPCVGPCWSTTSCLTVRMHTLHCSHSALLWSRVHTRTASTMYSPTTWTQQWLACCASLPAYHVAFAVVVAVCWVVRCPAAPWALPARARCYTVHSPSPVHSRVLWRVYHQRQQGGPASVAEPALHRGTAGAGLAGALCTVVWRGGGDGILRVLKQV